SGGCERDARPPGRRRLARDSRAGARSRRAARGAFRGEARRAHAARDPRAPGTRLERRAVRRGDPCVRAEPSALRAGRGPGGRGRQLRRGGHRATPRPRPADRELQPEYLQHGGARHSGAVLQLHAGVRLDAHRPRHAASRRLDGTRLRRRRAGRDRSVARNGRPAWLGHGVRGPGTGRAARRLSRRGRGAAVGQSRLFPRARRPGRRARGPGGAARYRLHGADAPRSRPHDLGGDRTPGVRAVRSSARRDVPAGPVGGPDAMSRPPLGYRWTVCALLFVVTTINYIDRQVLGILAPTLQRELHWSESQYGDIVSWFSLVYAFGFLAAGRALDRVGVRRGFAVAVVAWSIAAIGHAFARTAAGFSAARALLGLGESANF